MMIEQVHCVVTGADGRGVSFGREQAEWLRSRGHVESTGENTYRSLVLDAMELQDLVVSQPHLRNCDFCHSKPSPYRVEVREFVLTLGVNAGGKLGGEARPLWACSQCGPLLRTRNRRLLIGRAFKVHIKRAEKTTGRRIDTVAADALVTPMLAELIDLTLAADPRVVRA